MEISRLHSEWGHIPMIFVYDYDIVGMLCAVQSRNNLLQYHSFSFYKKINTRHVVPTETWLTLQRMTSESATAVSTNRPWSIEIIDWLHEDGRALSPHKERRST